MVEEQQKHSQQRVARPDAAACFPLSAAAVSSLTVGALLANIVLKKPHNRHAQFTENFSTQKLCKEPNQNKGHG